MAISTEEKQQILLDSFDMFKDDWESNGKTLKSTIAQIAMIDSSVAIQMWVYLLNRHSHKIKTDSEITSGILNILPEESYNEIVENNFIIEKIFKYSCEPWESVTLISHFLKVPDYYTSNRLLELASMNNTVSEYNYTDYKSSNLSTCLYKILCRLYNFNDSDIGFFSSWIERIEDKSENMKLKVLMLSKEKKESARTYKLVDNSGASANLSNDDATNSAKYQESIDVLSLISKICDGSICEDDLLNNKIHWTQKIFTDLPNYEKRYFNILGAYFSYIRLPLEVQKSIRTICTGSEPQNLTETLVQYLDSQIASIPVLNIKQQLDDFINEERKWNLNSITAMCEHIISLWDCGGNPGPKFMLLNPN